MHDKTHEKPEDRGLFGHALKSLSPAEFAALGAGSVIYVRPISGHDLARIIPQADVEPDETMVQLVMAADGTPIMVTDNRDAIDEWLEDKPVTLVTLH